MPVKKSAPQKRKASTRTRKSKASTASSPHMMEPPGSLSKAHDCCFSGACRMPFVKEEMGRTFGRRILWTLVGILLAYGIVLLGTMIRNNLEQYRYIGQAEKQERTITVEAEGTVTAKPDIAVTRMGMSVEGATVGEAQEENSKVMNTLIAKLTALGISEDDIQTTNYTISPRYEYREDSGQELRGYQVSQNITVKIRDVGKANAVLALAGDVGANNVGGIDFTLDDREVYINQAREEAMSKLRKKANVLSEMLGVRVVGVVSYDEFEVGGFDQAYPMREAYALGGSPPQINAGATDIIIRVRAVLEIQ